ncbi:MAG: pyrroline-5-carboxylate reductase [Clostridia bacterium]|nr:pyrroline-5-carboxylate reductase [Clostridia bacterium]
MLGFIGCGAMGGAICRGICKNSVVKPAEVCVYEPAKEKAQALNAELNVRTYDDCSEMILKCDMIILAVKPNVVESVLGSYREELAGKAIISIAAGWSTKQLREKLDISTRVLCVMPNTAALIGEAMTAFSRETTFTEQEKARAEDLFGAIGKVAWVEEKQISGVIGVSGSGPAYAYMFLQALADGGVEAGLTRVQATEMAAQMMLGAAKMALQSGIHPEALKDMVCSPGGTTIAAVHALEQGGFRGAVMDAVQAAAKKAGELT